MLKFEFNHVSRCYAHHSKKHSNMAMIKDLLAELKESRISSHLNIIQNSLRSKKYNITRSQWRKLDTAISDIHYIKRSLENMQM